MNRIFEIDKDYIELNKLLKASGLCESGGHAKWAVENGQVKVDGVVEYRKRRKLMNGMTAEYNSETLQVLQVKT